MSLIYHIVNWDFVFPSVSYYEIFKCREKMIKKIKYEIRNRESTTNMHGS
jgi:hypothetical protein